MAALNKLAAHRIRKMTNSYVGENWELERQFTGKGVVNRIITDLTSVDAIRSSPRPART